VPRALVARLARLVRARITGTTRAASDEWSLGDNYWKPNRTWPRRIETRVLGRATFDVRAGTFTTFEMVALGEREGRTIHNGCANDVAPSAIGFALQLAPPQPRIAPTFVNVYDADWVRDPRR
jgi:hypothetical protein